MRLLVIEDDPDLNRQLATALTDAGYVVDRAFDGEEGHYLGETEPYDAVILDIGLPKIDGYEACRRIRQHEWGRKTMVFALTGLGYDEASHASRSAGFDMHLVKPVEPEVLTTVLAATPRAT